MKPRDAFGVAIRVFGLAILFVSALYLYSVLMVIFGSEVLTAYGRSETGGPLGYGLACLVTLLIAAYFLRGAPHLVRFAYGAEKSDAEEKISPH